MKKLNWNSFGGKFDGQEQSAFERMAYALFCSRFNKHYGILAHKDQIGIETEPIKDNLDWIGFQAKYLEASTKFISYKKKIIDSLEKAKNKNPKINVIYFYVNKPFSESKKKGVKHPKHIVEIEAKAKELGLSIVWQVPSHLEKQLSNTENLRIAKEFFPELVEKKLDNQDVKGNSDNTTNSMSCMAPSLIKTYRDDSLEHNRTAIIQVEIAKIKFDFTYDWSESKEILDKLYVYADFRNETIARDILSFLNINVSSAARSNMPSSIAISIEGLVLTYFPSSYGELDKEMRIENGKECIYIGFNLAYDALIHTKNYEVAQWGLTIWKFIYRESKRNEMPELANAVLEQYKELEQTLERPGRNDLENAKELVKAYKDDLKTYDLSFPPLPEQLYRIINNSNK